MVDECLLLTSVVMVGVMVWLLGVDGGCSVVFFGVWWRCLWHRRAAICFPLVNVSPMLLCRLKTLPYLQMCCSELRALGDVLVNLGS